MMDWQPIETAPKDGRDILAWLAPHRVVMKWSAKHYGWVPSLGEQWLGVQPTHFAALPSPPPEQPQMTELTERVAHGQS